MYFEYCKISIKHNYAQLRSNSRDHPRGYLSTEQETNVSHYKYNLRDKETSTQVPHERHTHIPIIIHLPRKRYTKALFEPARARLGRGSTLGTEPLVCGLGFAAGPAKRAS